MDQRLGAALQRAVALDAEGKRDEAEAMLRQIVALDPENAEALHLLALNVGHGHRIAEARLYVDRAVAVDPDRAIFLRTQSELLRRLGEYAAAQVAGETAMALAPGDPVAPTILAAIAYQLRDVAAAERWSRHGLALASNYAEGHFELSKALLVQGKFAEGWEAHETRFRIFGAAPLMPPCSQPQWDGRPLSGRLLLIADQGFGDALQFMRYIPWARTICPDVALAVDASIRPLVARSFPDLWQFCDWNEAPDFVAYCPLSGLPRVHGTRAGTIPAAVPYVFADTARAGGWRARLNAVFPAGARRVGFAWAGRPTHTDDLNRSVPLDVLAPLAKVPGVAWVSLQKGPAREQLADVTWPAPLLDVGQATTDFDDTAAVIAGLDLVLAVDTSVAHLAGAMGKPVWIMLPYASDWRWLLDRNDSPWYPTVRLFRQPAPKDWASVVADVARALA